MKHWLAGCLILGGSGLAMAAEPPFPLDETLLWLNRMSHAARQLNYSGTFVSHSANRVESTRIVHLNDNGNELEKLEAMDGRARETLRTNDELTCFIPESKIIRREKRAFRRSFPALLPVSVADVSENYIPRKMGLDRVAGMDCQVVFLEPKDRLRYRQQFCAETGSGLILRAVMLDENGDVLEQYAFTQISIGIPMDKELLKSRFAERKTEWRTDQISATPIFPTEVKWSYGQPPSGFKKVAELHRTVAGKSGPVSQVVFSDGLVRVSVFIDASARPASATGPARQGNVNVYTRRAGDFQVTALGEVPSAAVQQLANTIQQSAKP